MSRIDVKHPTRGVYPVRIMVGASVIVLDREGDFITGRIDDQKPIRESATGFGYALLLRRLMQVAAARAA